jgi:hypothetical protein
MMTGVTSMSEPSRPLADRWVAVLGAGSGLFNLVDAIHPLRLYIGGNDSGRATFTVALDKRPAQVPQFVGVEIESRLREDGSWLLLVQLQIAGAFAEFVAMCDELVRRSAPATSESDGLRLLLEGLDQWRTLFKPVKDRLLSEPEMRGLAAELVCMLRIARPTRTWPDIIQGWKGPFGAAQDFQLADGLSIEAKSVHASSSSVKISSLEQLQVFEGRLLLATVLVELDLATTPGTVSLPVLCRSIEDELVGSFDLLDDFRAKLREVGYDRDELAYGDIWMRIGKVVCYEVGQVPGGGVAVCPSAGGVRR